MACKTIERAVGAAYAPTASSTLAASRALVDDLRASITAGSLGQTELQSAIDRLPFAIEDRLQNGLAHSLRPVINAGRRGSF